MNLLTYVIYRCSQSPTHLDDYGRTCGTSYHEEVPLQVQAAADLVSTAFGAKDNCMTISHSKALDSSLDLAR